MKTSDHPNHGKSVFAVGLAVLALAVLLAVQITMRPVHIATETTPGDPTSRRLISRPSSLASHPDGAATDLVANSSRPIAHPTESAHLASIAADRIGARPDRSTASAVAGRSPLSQEGEESLRIEVPADHPQRADLAARAERIAAHANRHLDVLTRQLDLTPAQRSKLFPSLAASSPEFDPAMRFADASGKPLQSETKAGETDPKPAGLAAAVEVVLEPTQADELIERQMDDKALWREIFSHLQYQLEARTPDVPEVPEEPPPLRRNIFDLIEPVR